MQVTEGVYSLGILKNTVVPLN